MPASTSPGAQPIWALRATRRPTTWPRQPLTLTVTQMLTPLATVHQRIKAKLRDACLVRPPLAGLRHLGDTHLPVEMQHTLASLPCPEALAITQLWAGHSPLLTFLYRINAADLPNCGLCQQLETIEHYLLLCR
ncbi:hypothetical protein CROQUDRAFT_679812 [Cronartium quercuum f. sp. fusiforme G11]|uniref:Reverse transcriptase zinc-binding domain-containing protein n=1 Tax=Cronartium quercuum f. sp. fusiforme G11 TaxID=708437 RepID=A0A9P6NF98_9BASI|nr:hypothetical protein CROQUDRAFT_679812 [Cronartium quercuum f. sp. fusiforme G11]